MPDSLLHHLVQSFALFRGQQRVASEHRLRHNFGVGTTTISWDTNDGHGHIYASENGGSEKLMASGAQGSKTIDWIAHGKYDFRLYKGKEQRTSLLRSRSLAKICPCEWVTSPVTE